MKKVVLAFSGGLDTTYCALHLARDLGYEVHAVTVNTGGFTANEAQNLQAQAEALGVKSYKFLDVTESFYREGVRFLLFGNVLKNNTYPLSVSAERVFQAKAIANYANERQADAICHGSTGAGNDQIRFDAVFHTLCPQKEIITPIRDQQLSRETEIAYLQAHGVDGDWKKAVYSINQGLWGTSVGGKETLTSDQPLPEVAYPSQRSAQQPETIQLHFEKGEPVGINDQKDTPVRVIRQLQEMASAYAIGRDTHVGDTIIGMKGRVGFEAPAPLILIKAHHLLEKHTLSKHQLFIKDQMSMWYGQLMHEGQYLDPAMRDLEALLESSQHRVCGQVTVKLMPYRFELLGISSQYDLMQADFGHYGEMNKAWTAEDARGFAKIFANTTKIHQAAYEKD